MPGVILSACLPDNRRIGFEGADMGNVITLLNESHGEAQSLLPWYLTGQIDASDRAMVEAHLIGCAECRSDLESERRLMSDWADVRLETEHSWLRLRERMEREPARTRQVGAGRGRLEGWRDNLASAWRSTTPRLGWALAAGLALALVIVGVSSQPPSRAAPYHTLGAGAASPAANVIVIFRPETSERTFRDLLNANHARIVDGPTAADAYLLRAPADEREAILARLRQRADIELAQPVDASDTR